MYQSADHVHWHDLSSRKTPLEINCKHFQTQPPTPETAQMIHKVQTWSVKQFLSMGADHGHWHGLSSRKTPLEINYKHFQTQPPTPETAQMIHKVQKWSVKQFLSMGADHVHWHDLSSRMTPQEINYKHVQTQPPTPETARMTHKVQT